MTLENALKIYDVKRLILNEAPKSDKAKEFQFFSLLAYFPIFTKII